jgi:hypothetical protein
MAEGAAMTQFWVTGGEYTDTRCDTLMPGAKEERYGPFATYREAYEFWSSYARATIDNATVKYRIVEARDTAA